MQEQKAADEAVLRESRKHTRRSFAIAAAAAAAGWGFTWIDSSQRLEHAAGALPQGLSGQCPALARDIRRPCIGADLSAKRAEDLRVNGVYG